MEMPQEAKRCFEGVSLVRVKSPHVLHTAGGHFLSCLNCQSQTILWPVCALIKGTIFCQPLVSETRHLLQLSFSWKKRKNKRGKGIAFVIYLFIFLHNSLYFFFLNSRSSHSPNHITQKVFFYEFSKHILTNLKKKKNLITISHRYLRI